MVIIAMFLLSLSGCGYRGDPYYLDSAPQSDKNVKFIIKKPSGDNNESSR
jgi:predicted small lipoprotein YifL